MAFVSLDHLAAQHVVALLGGVHIDLRPLDARGEVDQPATDVLGPGQPAAHDLGGDLDRCDLIDLDYGLQRARLSDFTHGATVVWEGLPVLEST
ncbi:hypothetical protein AMK15_16125 [Streptomyces sp. MJM1172]|nr:hypothetical protein AMK15_16125 [Streptomyces sp. MJM1172]